MQPEHVSRELARTTFVSRLDLPDLRIALESAFLTCHASFRADSYGYRVETEDTTLDVSIYRDDAELNVELRRYDGCRHAFGELADRLTQVLGVSFKDAFKAVGLARRPPPLPADFRCPGGACIEAPELPYYFKLAETTLDFDVTLTEIQSMLQKAFQLHGIEYMESLELQCAYSCTLSELSFEVSIFKSELGHQVEFRRMDGCRHAFASVADAVADELGMTFRCGRAKGIPDSPPY